MTVTFLLNLYMTNIVQSKPLFNTNNATIKSSIIAWNGINIYLLINISTDSL